MVKGCERYPNGRSFGRCLGVSRFLVIKRRLIDLFCVVAPPSVALGRWLRQHTATQLCSQCRWSPVAIICLSTQGWNNCSWWSQFPTTLGLEHDWGPKCWLIVVVCWELWSMGRSINHLNKTQIVSLGTSSLVLFKPEVPTPLAHIFSDHEGSAICCPNWWVPTIRKDENWDVGNSFEPLHNSTTINVNPVQKPCPVVGQTLAAFMAHPVDW